MIPLSFSIGFVLYIVTVCLLYSTTFKASPFYYWIGVSIGLVTSSLWLFIAKNSDTSNLYVRGLFWDCMIVGAYVLIPPLFFGVKLEPMTTIGCVLIVTGMILTKI